MALLQMWMYLFSRLADLVRDRRGNIAVIAALAAPVVIGAFGLGTEAAAWLQEERGMQNAADAAAIAAATNAGANYHIEAQAVAARYGLVNGANGVVVSASNAAACPGGGRCARGPDAAVGLTGIVERSA
jgi:Flp pilus assembly protein TadG